MDDDAYLRFRAVISEIIRAHDGSQAAAASRLGIHDSTIYRWVSGQVRPSPRTLRAIGPVLEETRRRATSLAVAAEMKASALPEDDDDDIS